MRFDDKRPEGLTNPDGGFALNESLSDTYAGEFAFDLPFRFQVVEKVAYKDEKIYALNDTLTIKTSENLRSVLNIHRLNYHLTKKIDAAVEYRTLNQNGSDLSEDQNGFLFESTYQVVDHVAVGLGYNFTGFTDDFTARSRKRAEGFFVRLQGRY